MNPQPHQYIERTSGRVVTERLLGDRAVRMLYSGLRERASLVFKALTGPRCSSLLGFLNYDAYLGGRLRDPLAIMGAWGVDVSELLDPPQSLDTPRKIFERKIRYEDCRPLSDDEREVAAPADSRVLLGSLAEDARLFIKEKFFDYHELVGVNKVRWLRAFKAGDFTLFRLTPEKYHYNHTPVAGRVVDCYQISGGYHACNPSAMVSLVTPLSKNRRVVTVIDTDVPGGTGCGLVAMVEVVALMIGDIQQCYSARSYDDPWPADPGWFVEKGCPKSLFRPGSSTVLLLFQPGRVSFDRDLVDNLQAPDVVSRFSRGFGQPLVETEVTVRSGIGRALR